MCLGITWPHHGSEHTLRGSENQRHFNLVWNKNCYNNIKNLIYLFIKLVMKLSLGITWCQLHHRSCFDILLSGLMWVNVHTYIRLLGNNQHQWSVIEPTTHQIFSYCNILEKYQNLGVQWNSPLAMYICMKNLQCNHSIMIKCKIIKSAPSDECLWYPKMVKCIIFKSLQTSNTICYKMASHFNKMNALQQYSLYLAYS